MSTLSYHAGQVMGALQAAGGRMLPSALRSEYGPAFREPTPQDGNPACKLGVAELVNLEGAVAELLGADLVTFERDGALCKVLTLTEAGRKLAGLPTPKE